MMTPVVASTARSGFERRVRSHARGLGRLAALTRIMRDYGRGEGEGFVYWGKGSGAVDI